MTETIEIAAETMRGDLRDMILGILRHEQSMLPWHMRPEDKQRETIERVETSVRSAIDNAVKIIAADRRPFVVADMEKIEIKDDLKMLLKLYPTSDNVVSVNVIRGQRILVIAAGAEQFQGHRSPVEVVKNQGEMPLHDEDGVVFDNTAAGERG